MSSGKVQEVDVIDKEKEHMAILQDAVEIKVFILLISFIFFDYHFYLCLPRTSGLVHITHMAPTENTGGADGEPQRGPPEAALPAP